MAFPLIHYGGRDGAESSVLKLLGRKTIYWQNCTTKFYFYEACFMKLNSLTLLLCSQVVTCNHFLRAHWSKLSDFCLVELFQNNRKNGCLPKCFPHQLILNNWPLLLKCSCNMKREIVQRNSVKHIASHHSLAGFRVIVPGFRELLHEESVHEDQRQLEPAHLQCAWSQGGHYGETVSWLQLVLQVSLDWEVISEDFFTSEDFLLQLRVFCQSRSRSIESTI